MYTKDISKQYIFMKKRLFSGVQPSGRIHLGNYLGAIKQWVALQDEFEAIFCVVDLHAITVPQDSEELRRKTLETAKIYLALGIDPEKSHIFVQSHITGHSELAWILNTIARLGDLEKMTQFKDKSTDRETAGVGLFDYPVLMAADILLYNTDVVPVGEDQTQHVELARTLARRFNKRFGETFSVPQSRVMKKGARIMGLDDPTRKMSKSATSEYNFIAFDDDVDLARKKIMKAVTDSGSGITYSDDRPGLKNLITIYSLLGNKEPEEIVSAYTGRGCADFKKDLADIVGVFLQGFQENYAQLSDKKVCEILSQGRDFTMRISQEKMTQVREKVGFLALG